MSSSGVVKTALKTQKPSDKEFVYAFATLRSMEGVQLLKSAYNRYSNPCDRCCIKFWHLFCCRCIMKREYNRIKLREIDGQWPETVEAIMPDNI